MFPFIIIIIIIVFNCKWVDTRWQQCGYNLHTNSTQNTKNKTYIAKQKKKWS